MSKVGKGEGKRLKSRSKEEGIELRYKEGVQSRRVEKKPHLGIVDFEGNVERKGEKVIK